MIIDSHTHIFPAGWVERRTELAAREPLFAEMYGDPRARMATAPELLRAMDAHAIDRAVVCGFGWDDPDLCRSHNDAILELAATSAGRLIPFASVSLRHPELAVTEAERCRALGAAGFGELRPEWQGREIGREEDAALLATVAGGLPLLIHASEPAGHNYPGKQGQSIGGLYQFLRRHPELTVIAAHFGGGLPLLAHMPRVAEACANLYVDTAAWPLLYRPAVFRTVADLIGAERILFATDFPLRRYSKELELIRAAPLTNTERQQVLGDNAAALFRVERSG